MAFEIKKCPKRRIAAAGMDLALLLLLQIPLQCTEYINAWRDVGSNASSLRRTLISVAFSILTLYSVIDVVGSSPGKMLLGLVVYSNRGSKPNLYHRILRWALKWWWLLLSPVLLDAARPSGSIFWLFGMHPPLWTQNLLTLFEWVTAAAILLNSVPILVGISPLHDKLSGTVVGLLPEI